MDNASPVACIGECMVELSERPDGSLSRSFGGDTLNTALYLARLGVRTDYVTALGDDALSDEMLSAWAAEEIGIGLVARVPGRLPGLYMIRTDPSGERRFLYWRDSAPVRHLFQLPQIGAIERALCGATLIYLSGITLSLFDAVSRDRLFAVLARARDVGVKVAFDTNFRPRGWPDRAVARDVYARAFGHADLVFASVDDHALLHEVTDADPATVLDHVRACAVGEIVVKYATPVCRVVADGADLEVTALPVSGVVDTTAAGDSFAAAYLAARLCGERPGVAARAGHALAGVVVRHRGAIIPRAAMPTRLSARSSP